MDFPAAWAAFSIGTEVAVSTGEAAPSLPAGSLAMKIWNSHNFTGTLVAKISGLPRQMSFNLAADGGGNVIGFLVSEEYPHLFVSA